MEMLVHSVSLSPPGFAKVKQWCPVPYVWHIRGQNQLQQTTSFGAVEEAMLNPFNHILDIWERARLCDNEVEAVTTAVYVCC